MITWQLLSFTELTTTQLYELLKLRTDVFVVEQACPYPELDGKDCLDGVYHLLGVEDNILIACARLLPKGVSYPSVSIGRVATHKANRGGGLGHKLIAEAITGCEQLWPDCEIEIGAQYHLADFYKQHGFVQTSEVYSEDSIPHIKMKRSRNLHKPHTLDK